MVGIRVTPGLNSNKTANVSVELSDDRSDVVLSTNASAGMGSKGGKGVEVADWVVALEKKDAFRVTRSSSGARDGGERDVRWDLNIKTSALLNGQKLNLAFSASPTLGTSSVQCRMPVRDGLFVSAAYDTSNLRRLERDRLTVGFEQSLGVSTIVSGEYSFGDASATLTATRVVDPVNILQATCLLSSTPAGPTRAVTLELVNSKGLAGPGNLTLGASWVSGQRGLGVTVSKEWAVL